MPRLPLKIRLERAYEQGKADGKLLGKMETLQDKKRVLDENRELIANETVREAIKSLRTINYMLLRVMVR